METLSERISAGILAILSIGGNVGGAHLVETPQWQLCTQGMAMLVGLVSIAWMIYQMTRKKKKL